MSSPSSLQCVRSNQMAPLVAGSKALKRASSLLPAFEAMINILEKLVYVASSEFDIRSVLAMDVNLSNNCSSYIHK
jgi:hypothetical protein